MTGSQGRRWSDEDKRAVCREAVEGSDPVAHVAKRHGIRKARLYYWLKDPRFNPTLEENAANPSQTGFIPVSVEDEDTSQPIAVNEKLAAGRLEPLRLGIRLAGGHEVFLSGAVSAEIIVQVLRELRV
ncbi:transposase [Pseudovibrio ascidiaceicola]|uniref:transposase n=1 Tax=Pseudovibrio ascidiaceicola TaxID=285279 RepID=UPI003D35E0E3